MAGSLMGICMLWVSAGAFASVEEETFVWYDGRHAVTYGLASSVSPVVHTALDMWCGDVEGVTGQTPREVRPGKATVRILQLDRQPAQVAQLREAGIPVDSLLEHKEAFCLKVADGRLWIVGSDARGTAYGILELSRMAGVSPWVWWGDVHPERKERLEVPAEMQIIQHPSVEYRGIFLNDEDWSLQPWSWQTFEPSPVKGRIGPRTYKEIFKLLLRLRANMIWPGMHGITTPFYEVPGAKEVADSCGIVIGTSHCEPLMRNNVGEWDVKRRGHYNYVTNRDSVLAYWAERLKEVHAYENFYTVGMRGIHDGSMEGVKTLQEKTDALQQVLNDQRRLLAQYVNRDVERVPQVFVPYKEVLRIMDNGLQVPDDVTLMWCDDNYGYLTRLGDAAQRQRKGGAGVYYHLSYWGRPLDYLWLCTTQPGLIYSEMKKAYDHHARKLWIVNVHDLKPAAYDLELFLDMAWDIHSVSPSTLYAHQERWLCREFGGEAGRRLLPAMQEFYRLCGIRKPEFMGWNQVELDKKKYIKGWSPVQNTEFGLTEFGGELDRYLADYDRVRTAVAEAEQWVPAHRRDAFFAQIKYPVFAAAAMSRKMLEAQRARMLAAGACDTTLWTRGPALMQACARSLDAYREIRLLTDYYNQELAGGKWRHSMCDHPRDLYMFYPPTLPIGLTEEEVRRYAGGRPSREVAAPDSSKSKYIARNAARYTRVSGEAAPIQALGHSMKAVALAPGSTLVYEFDSPWEGEAMLRTAVIPTHPSGAGNIRFSVSVDGEEPQVCSFKEGYRSEAWKHNVLRGQAVRQTTHRLSKGRHRLEIRALDETVIVDQWMFDFKPERKFYVFPLRPDYE